MKIIFTLVFILAINLMAHNSKPGFILFFSLILAITLISKVELIFLLKRSLIALPFFLSAIPLIVWGPEPIIQVNVLHLFTLPVSPIGIERCISIMIKALLSVQAAILLTATTRFYDLILGLRQLRVPAILISIIELMWRYLFVMVDEVTRLIRARNSRSSVVNHGRHAGGSVFWRANVTGNMAGSLFLRSIERSERVYAAMLSRGYNGEPLDEPAIRFTRQDTMMSIVGVLIIAVIFLFSIITGR